MQDTHHKSLWLTAFILTNFPQDTRDRLFRPAAATATQSISDRRDVGTLSGILAPSNSQTNWTI